VIGWGVCNADTARFADTATSPHACTSPTRTSPTRTSPVAVAAAVTAAVAAEAPWTKLVSGWGVSNADAATFAFTATSAAPTRGPLGLGLGDALTVLKCVEHHVPSGWV